LNSKKEFLPLSEKHIHLLTKIWLLKKSRALTFFSAFHHALGKRLAIIYPMLFPVFLKTCRGFMGMVIGRMDGTIGAPGRSRKTGQN
jgi:hypothetical protein